MSINRYGLSATDLTSLALDLKDFYEVVDGCSQ